MISVSRVRAVPVRRASWAFTLLEILVVLAIIGLLFTLAVTNVGNIFGNGSAI